MTPFQSFRKQFFCIYLLLFSFSYGYSQSDPFITEWETTAPNESITIPTTGTGYDYTIDWGDGTTTTGTTANPTHVYANAGFYQVEISGTFPRIYFINSPSSNAQKLKKVLQWGDIAWSSMNSAFYNCENLNITASDAPDLSNVTSLSNMFRNCDVSVWSTNALANWDVSTITDMSGMFAQASSSSGNADYIFLNLNSWDVSNVTNMSAMFSSITSDVAAVITNWDVSSVTNMSRMFEEAEYISSNISGWNTTSLTNMSYMFLFAQNVPSSITNWDVSNVTNMIGVFDNAFFFDIDLSNWDVSSVTNMTNIFQNTSLSITNYDNILTAWSSLPNLQPNVNLGAGSTTYCAYPGRQALIQNHGWTISDGGVDNSCTNGFITEWETTVNDESITLPTTGTGYDYTIDWGDGTITTGTTGDPSHTYATPGSYQVQVFGSFPRIYFNGNFSNSKKLKKILQWGDIVWTSMENAFYNCYEMELLATDAPDLSNVSSLHGMFRRVRIVDFLATTFIGWDVSTITNMSYMFAERQSDNLFADLGNWDVSNVTDMSYMFWEATIFNSTNIGNWDVSGVITMEGMFSNSGFIDVDLSNWDLSSVTNMSNMFDFAKLLPTTGLSNWDVSNVTDMSDMFKNHSPEYLPDFTTWDVSNVTNMNSMFYGVDQNPVGITNWDVSSVTNMGSMFGYCDNLNQDLNSWDVSSVTNMSNMFESTTAFDQDLSSWDVSNVNNMEFMFLYAGISTANYDATLMAWAALPNLQPNVNFGAGNSQYCALIDRQYLIDTYNWVITDAGISPGCAQSFITEWETTVNDESITLPTTGTGYDYTIDWGDGTITTGTTGDPSHTYATPGSYQVQVFGSFPRIYFNGNFSNSKKLKKILQWGDIVWTSMENAFYNCYEMELLATDAPDLSNVSSLHGMFRRVRIVDFLATTFIGWDVSTITDMSYMFAERQSDNLLADLGNWDVSNVTDMSFMFWEATIFNSTNIGNWDVSGVITMEGMFSNSGFIDVDLSNWDLSSVTNMSQMFDFAKLLPTTGLSNWDVSNVTDMSDMFKNHSPEYLPDFTTWDVSNVTNMNSMFYGVDQNPVGITNWDVSSVTNMGSMFGYCDNLNQDLNSWDVSSVTNMSNMFESTTAFDQDLSSWDVSNVTNMQWMFLYAGISTANYDATLMAWAALPNLQPNVNFGAGNSQYCTGATARCDLANNYNWTITDGGKEAACTYLVLSCPSDMVVSTDPGTCDAIVNYFVDHGEGCAEEILTQTTGLASGSTFPLGATMNTFEVTDNNGNTGTCSFTVTVNDDELPTAICKNNTKSLSNSGRYKPQVHHINNGSFDNCGAVTMTVAPALFFCDDIGDVVVTLTVEDSNGNISTCQSTITLEDTKAPKIRCPQDIIVDGDPGSCDAIVDYEVLYIDNCAGFVLSQLQGLPTGSAFPLGTTLNEFEVVDAQGLSKSCSFNVTVNDPGGCGPQSPDYTNPGIELINESTVLLNAYPNPFYDKATIEFQMESTDQVELQIYDMNGQLIEMLEQSVLTPGNYQYTWNAAQNQVQAGIYFVRLVAGEEIRNLRLVLVAR